MSDTSNSSGVGPDDESAVPEPTTADAVVPDAHPEAAAGATAADASVDPPSTADSSTAPKTLADDKKSSADSQRLLIGVGILVVVAIAAIVIGISRRSSEPVATTNTTASTATTAAGGKSSTTKAGQTGTTKPGAKTSTTKAGDAGGGGTPTTAACQAGSWPKLYTAKVDSASLTKAGVYVWNENPGWRLRIVDPAGGTYSGEIVATAAMESKLFKPSNNATTVDVKDTRATFEVTASGTATGLDFAMGCAVDQFSIAVTTKGALVSPDVITVGKDSHSVGNPIIVMKST